MQSIKEINAQLVKIGEEIKAEMPSYMLDSKNYNSQKTLIRLAVRCIEQQEYSASIIGKDYDGNWRQGKTLRFDASRNDELFALLKRYKAANFEF